MDEHEREVIYIAELAKYDPKDRQSYEDSLKYYRDLKNSNDTAWRDGFGEGVELGREEGREEGRQESREEGAFKKAQDVARSLLQLGILPAEAIAHTTGLPLDEVRKLQG